MPGLGIIPNKEAGITPGVLWAVTDPANTTYNLNDPASYGGLTERLSSRDQATVVDVLKQKVKTDPNWQGSSSSVFQGISGGLPGMFLTFFGQLLGIDPTTLTALEGDLNGLLGLVEQVPVIGQLLQIFTGSTTGGGGGILGLTNVFGDLLGLLGLGSGSGLGTGSPTLGSNIPILGPLISLFTSFLSGGSSTSGALGDLTPLLNNIPLIGPLLELFTGSTTGAGGGIGGLTNVFGDLLGLLGLGSGSGLGTGSPTLGSNIPLLGPLVSLFSSFLSGGSSSSNLLTDLAPLLNNIPLIGQLLQIFTGSTTGAGGGISGLSSVFGDLLGLLGLGTGSGLGSGSPTLGSNIPLLGPLVSLFSSFLSGGSSSSSLLTDLEPLLTNIPLLGPLIGALTGGNLSGSGATLGNLGSFFNFGPGTTSIMSLLTTLGTDFAQLVEAFIPGMSTGTKTDFNNIIGNILSMLGKPLGLLSSGSGFDPIAAVQQFASLVGVPAGLLSSNSVVPIHTLGGLTASSNGMVNAYANADPGFSDPTRFEGNSIWSLDLTLDHTGVVGSGSAKFVANGTPGQLVGVPITVNPGTQITLGTYAHWAGISALAGNAIMLSVNAYDVNDRVIADPTHRVISAVATPGTSSAGFSHADAINPSNTLTADAAGWVYLSGSYTTPPATAYVCLCLEVGANVNTGQTNFDDIALYLPGLVDATLLHNFESMAQGTVPGAVMQGFQGLVDIFGSFGHLLDGLGSGMSLAPQSGLTFANLFGIAQDSSTNALDALTQGIINANQLNFRQNKTSGNGANNTTEAMIPLAHFGSGGALTTTTVPAGTSILQRLNPAEVAQKGFFEFLGSLPSGATGGVFLNLLKWNGTSWDRTWSSTDIASLLPTAITDVTRVLVPGGVQPTVNAGETYLVGLANNTASTLTVVAKDTGIPNNSHETIPNYGATRTLASSGGATPTNVAHSALTFSGKVPYFGSGILNVPASYVPPQTFPFDVPGPFTFTIPTWARVAGATLDLIGLGPGGGGQANYGTLTWWTGGNAGSFVTQRLVCGVDYPVGATTITGVVGTKGLAAGAFWTNGHKGTDTTITWNDGTTNHTITAAAGEGGGNTGTSGTNGKSPGTRVFQGQQYPGGGEVGGNANGNPAGGGGGGAGPYQTGGDGADGKVWIRASQPT